MESDAQVEAFLQDATRNGRDEMSPEVVSQYARNNGFLDEWIDTMFKKGGRKTTDGLRQQTVHEHFSVTMSRLIRDWTIVFQETFVLGFGIVSEALQTGGYKLATPPPPRAPPPIRGRARGGGRVEDGMGGCAVQTMQIITLVSGPRR